MLAEFEPTVRENPWFYRQLHWEAGLIGQTLYLEAEAAGLRGTGVGCFFDDETHDFLGLKTPELQTLYHFTVGCAAHRRAHRDTTRLSRQTPTKGVPAMTLDLQDWLAAEGFLPDDINATIANRTTPLMRAAFKGEVDMARKILSLGRQGRIAQCRWQ